jgi:hypothetical protein
LEYLEREIDERPCYMVRKGSYKLMIQKLASSTNLDMMFHLDTDPFEINNKLGHGAMSADEATVSKAEHMRCLLLDWMGRLDGSVGYFSDPAANFGEGSGDMNEIRTRQSWPQLGLWVSDATLTFGTIGWNGQNYVRNEYLYVGTRRDEQVEITSISVIGADATYFHVVNGTAGGIITVGYNACHAIKVSFVASTKIWMEKALDATMVIVLTAAGLVTEKTIQLHVPSL